MRCLELEYAGDVTSSQHATAEVAYAAIGIDVGGFCDRVLQLTLWAWKARIGRTSLKPKSIPKQRLSMAPIADEFGDNLSI